MNSKIVNVNIIHMTYIFFFVKKMGMVSFNTLEVSFNIVFICDWLDSFWNYVSMYDTYSTSRDVNRYIIDDASV